MIKINYEGRLGNNLFQYGRALCDSIENNNCISNPLSTKIFKNITLKHSIQQTYTQNGFFQDEETISKFLKYKDKIFNKIDTEEGLFVHVRLGDIANNFPAGRSCDIGYYEKCLNNIKQNKGPRFISSDSPSNKIVIDLIDKFNLELFQAPPEETIIFASKFKNKILSLGTFSWWIGFLGAQDNVFFPDPSKYKKWHGDIFIFDNWIQI